MAMAIGKGHRKEIILSPTLYLEHGNLKRKRWSALHAASLDFNF